MVFRDWWSRHRSLYGRDAGEPNLLFLLVTVLSQSLFALVRGHLVALSFLSAGHGDYYFIVNIMYFVRLRPNMGCMPFFFLAGS